jgi:hypothetical protein
MNVAMGVGGTLTLIAGVLFFVVIGMTMFAGKKPRVTSEPGGDLAMLEIRPTREFVYTPTALIPGVIFVLVVLMFTAGAFGIIGNWPIQFG